MPSCYWAPRSASRTLLDPACCLRNVQAVCHGQTNRLIHSADAALELAICIPANARDESIRQTIHALVASVIAYGNSIAPRVRRTVIA